MQADGKPEAVCWGELLWDLFPGGACLGGAPSNVAVHLAALGASTALITRIGDDELGRKAIGTLDERGIDARGLQIDAKLQTGRVGVTIEDSEPRYTLQDGAWQRIACDEAARQVLAECRALCFGTLSQETSDGLASWRQAIASVAPSCHIICDPNLRGGRIDPALVREHLEAATVIKINDVEHDAIGNAFGVTEVVPWLLGEMGVSLVAHTHGAAGASLHRAGEAAHHPGFAARAGGDNVGAGDASVAVLTLGLLRGTELPALVEAANRYGSFVASERGATPLPSNELRRELDALLG